MTGSENMDDEKYWNMSVKDKIKAMRLEQENKSSQNNSIPFPQRQLKVKATASPKKWSTNSSLRSSTSNSINGGGIKAVASFGSNSVKSYQSYSQGSSTVYDSKASKNSDDVDKPNVNKVTSSTQSWDSFGSASNPQSQSSYRSGNKSSSIEEKRGGNIKTSSRISLKKDDDEREYFMNNDNGEYSEELGSNRSEQQLDRSCLSYDEYAEGLEERSTLVESHKNTVDDDLSLAFQEVEDLKSYNFDRLSRKMARDHSKALQPLLEGKEKGTIRPTHDKDDDELSLALRYVEGKQSKIELTEEYRMDSNISNSPEEEYSSDGDDGESNGSYNNPYDDDDLSQAFQDVHTSQSEDFDQLYVKLSSDHVMNSKNAKPVILNTLLDRLSQDRAAMDDTDISVIPSNSETTIHPVKGLNSGNFTDPNRKSSNIESTLECVTTEVGQLTTTLRSPTTPASDTNSPSSKSESALSKRAKSMLYKRRKDSSLKKISLAKSPPRSADSLDDDVPMDEPISTASNRILLQTPPTARKVVSNKESLSKSPERIDDDVPMDEPIPTTKTRMRLQTPPAVLKVVSKNESKTDQTSSEFEYAKSSSDFHKKSKETLSATIHNLNSRKDQEAYDETNLFNQIDSPSKSKMSLESPYSEEQYEEFILKLQKSSLAALSNGIPHMNEASSFDSDRTEKMSNVNDTDDYESLPYGKDSRVSTFSEASSYTSNGLQNMMLQHASLSPSKGDDGNENNLRRFMIQHPSPSRKISEERVGKNVGKDHEQLTQSLHPSSPLQYSEFRNTIKNQKQEKSGYDDVFNSLSNAFADIGKYATDMLEGGAAIIGDVAPKIEKQNDLAKTYASQILGLDLGLTQTKNSNIDDSFCEDIAIEVEYVESEYSSDSE